jgi:hypothetical protein
MMAELILLTFNRRDVDALHKAARKGDESAVVEFEHIWDEHAGREIACFLCDHQTDFPPHTMMLPEPAERSQLIGAPLCATCRELPNLVRWNRCLALLRQLHKAKTGKQVHFQLTSRMR